MKQDFYQFEKDRVYCGKSVFWGASAIYIYKGSYIEGIFTKYKRIPYQDALKILGKKPQGGSVSQVTGNGANGMKDTYWKLDDGTQYSDIDIIDFEMKGYFEGYNDN
jgi:hypothetical protein